MNIVKIDIKAVWICLILLCSGCLENDIPYARIPAEILNIEVQGQLEETEINPVINYEDRTVRFVMQETADLRKIVINEIQITEGATVSPELKKSTVLDLKTPKIFTLSIWQDYQWTISAEQPIERYFKVDKQVGNAYIDPDKKIAIAYVEEGTDLSNITITALKLGPENASMVPKMESIINFTEAGGVTVVVVYHSEREVWTLSVAIGEAAALTVDAWEKVAWLKGEGKASGTNGFQYKESSASEWETVPEQNIEFNGGIFSTRINGLKENTSYLARSYSDDEYSGEVPFTTGQTRQLPNNSFENWSQLSNDAWVVYSPGEEMFWDTGNHGSITLKKNVTVYDETTKHSGNRSAKLESQFVSFVVGKFAAGNLFAGEYKETDGTNGILDFGRPFTSHPTKLNFWYKCNISKITHSTLDDYPVGAIDPACVYIALGDWDQPVEIRTRSSNRKVFDPNDSHVIAYGELIINESVTNWTNYTIDLEYRATDRKPKYIVVVASASRWGEYFTGSTANILWLDDMTLVYD